VGGGCDAAERCLKREPRRAVSRLVFNPLYFGVGRLSERDAVPWFRSSRPIP
jgi:hypothetical protein